MKTKFSGILTLLLAFMVQITFAQTTVSGTISDATAPLPGANVVVKGTSNGAQTDFDGNFTLSNVNSTDILVISYVGFKTQELPVGSQSTFTVTLELDNTLEEVVVTAQGIKREKKALGYAISTVDSEEIQDKPEQDVTRALLGKASGVQITQTSGLAGSGTNVIIRNTTSVDGNNQALFIVDGVPFNNDTNAVGGVAGFSNGNNGASRSLDLDPNNIESVSVLKGLAAATLYGSAGRNGVILITTKTGSRNKGAKKNEVTVSQSYFVDEIASLADYQNEFGNGFNQQFGFFFSNFGSSFSPDGVAGFNNDPGVDADGTTIHPYSGRAAFPEFQDAREEFRPFNSVPRFFRTGGVSNTNVTLRGSTDNTFYNVSFSHSDQRGFTPGNTLRRNNLSIGGGSNLTNKFNITGNLNFSRTDFVTPPVSESDGSSTIAGTSSVFGDLFYTPRSVDLIGLPFENPIDGSSEYYRQGNDIQHPLWTVANAQVSQLTNRVQGNTVLTYNFDDHINVFYRAGIDVFNTLAENFQNAGGVDSNVTGFLNTTNLLNEIYDHTLQVNGDYDFGPVGFTFNAAATTRLESSRLVGIASTGQSVFDVQRHFVFENNDQIEGRGTRNIAGVYGQITADYDNQVFLTVAGRNDWVSNLTQENRALFYPSASASWLPTASIPSIKSDKWGLNYLKIRAGVGTSARFPDAGQFPTSQTLAFAQQVFSDTSADTGTSGVDIAANAASNTLANPDLEPELQTEIEFGFESRFVDNRIRLDATYFDRNTRDLILTSPIPGSTGSTTTTVNVGRIEGNGFEADLGIDIFRGKKFTWTSRVNFTTNESIVTSLGTDVEQIIFGGNLAFGANVAREGFQLGSIVGSRIGRDENGNFLVGGDGSFLEELADEEGLAPIIGDPNPDYIVNYINDFTWGNWNFGFQINHTQGGDILSRTASVLVGRGLTTDTLDRLNTFILPGIDVGTGEPNNRQITNSDFFFDNLGFGPRELQVFDATVIRLQQVSFGYSFPAKLLDTTPFGALSITASGQNLWFDAVNTPDGVNFDPNTVSGVGNGRGIDRITGPSGRRWGVAVRATF